MPRACARDTNVSLRPFALDSKFASIVNPHADYGNTYLATQDIQTAQFQENTH